MNKQIRHKDYQRLLLQIRKFLRLPNQLQFVEWYPVEEQSLQNTIPVPYRKDASVLVPFGHDVCTSVGHKIGFQIFAIPIFASHGTIGNHTNVKCIVGTDMKSIVSSESNECVNGFIP